MTTRLSCWTDWILRLAAVAGIMASRDRVQSRRLRTWTIQHLLGRRLAQEFEHFAAVSREWNRLAKWQLGADFRQRNPGIRPYGVRGSTKRGGFGGTQLTNVYQEVGSCANPLGHIGQAGW